MKILKDMIERQHYKIPEKIVFVRGNIILKHTSPKKLIDIGCLYNETEMEKIDQIIEGDFIIEENTETFEALRDGRGDALSNDNTFLFAWAKQNQGYTAIQAVSKKRLLSNLQGRDSQLFHQNYQYHQHHSRKGFALYRKNRLQRHLQREKTADGASKPCSVHAQHRETECGNAAQSRIHTQIPALSEQGSAHESTAGAKQGHELAHETRESVSEQLEFDLCPQCR